MLAKSPTPAAEEEQTWPFKFTGDDREDVWTTCPPHSAGCETVGIPTVSDGRVSLRDWRYRNCGICLLLSHLEVSQLRCYHRPLTFVQVPPRKSCKSCIKVSANEGTILIQDQRNTGFRRASPARSKQ